MVGINEFPLPEYTGEGCGGETDICTDSRVHHRSAENRAPTTRNHRGAPILGRWMEQDPAHYINGANTYQFVDSSPVGNEDAEGLAGFTLAYRTRWVPRRRHEGAFHGWYIRWLIRPQNKIIFPASLHEFVIQHMDITVSVFDAKTGLPIHSKDGHISYWEAWHAVPGARVPRWHSMGGTNDIWRWRTREGRHTKGRITFVGTAAFYTGATLKGWAKKNHGHSRAACSRRPKIRISRRIAILSLASWL
jgi:hypothetical protein